MLKWSVRHASMEVMALARASLLACRGTLPADLPRGPEREGGVGGGGGGLERVAPRVRPWRTASSIIRFIVFESPSTVFFDGSPIYFFSPMAEGAARGAGAGGVGQGRRQHCGEGARKWAEEREEKKHLS